MRVVQAIEIQNEREKEEERKRGRERRKEGKECKSSQSSWWSGQLDTKNVAHLVHSLLFFATTSAEK